MIVLIVVIFLLLTLITGAKPHQSAYSGFERRRRAGSGGSKVERDLLRHQTHDGVIVWLGIKELLLATALVLLLIGVYDLRVGILLGVLAIFVYKIIGQMQFVRRPAQKLYDRYELEILQGVDKLQPVTKLLRRSTNEREVSISSREELVHLIEQSSRMFEQKEYDLIKSALQFNELVVGDFMTPRESIDIVAVGELLGPLVLDDLHKTGHHRFPVVKGDIDHIVGILDVQDLLTVGDKRSPQVRNVMNPRVCYVHQAQTLESTLAAFVKTTHHLLIVVDDTEATVGLLSLGDIISVLLGRAVSDDFDEFDNLRAVASQNIPKS